MTETLKKYIDNIQTVEIMRAFIAAIPLGSNNKNDKLTQEISDYSTNKLNHLLLE